MKKTDLIHTTNFTIKISVPDGSTPVRAGLMFHGWTGDENSMWVFTNQLDDDWLLIAPRAPYPTIGADLGGYSWINQPIDHWPLFNDFLPAVNLLHSDLVELRNEYPNFDISELTLFGFSQGAAMALVYSLVYCADVRKLALLSGFSPDDSESYFSNYSSSPPKVFIGHGTDDIIVPVEKAKEVHLLFKDKGINPQVCFSNVGHLLGSDCFKAFASFINQR